MRKINTYEDFSYIFNRSTVVESVGALAVRAILLFDGQVLFPYLLAFNLFIVHADHLAVQLPATVLNIKDLTALQSLLVTMNDIDYEHADGQPDHKDNDDERLNTDIVDDR